MREARWGTSMEEETDREEADEEEMEKEEAEKEESTKEGTEREETTKGKAEKEETMEEDDEPEEEDPIEVSIEYITSIEYRRGQGVPADILELDGKKVTINMEITEAGKLLDPWEETVIQYRLDQGEF